MPGKPREHRQSNVGKQIEQSRLSRGWSLRQAEKESGVSNGYISQIERGEVEPSPDVLRRLGQAFGIPFSVLMEAAGYATKRPEARDTGGVPAFVFSAAEIMDERDWDATQAFFHVLLSKRKKNGDEQS